MILYTDNQADNAVITSPESSIFNPPSNVKDSRLSRVFKGDEQTSLQIAGSGSLKNISQGYTNLVSDPTDLTTANWSEGNATATDSGETINGYKLWTVTGDSVGTYRQIQNTAFVCTSDIIVFSAIARKGTSDTSLLVVNNNTVGTTHGQITITSFASKTVGTAFGATLLKEKWLDDDTVALVGLANTSSITIGDSLEIRVFSNGSVSDQTNTLWTQPQITQGSTTRYPFINGSKTADVIDETFTMPDRFTGRIRITPNFAYDTTPSNKALAAWRLDTNNRLLFYYEDSADRFQIYWENGGTGRVLISQIFDDGTTYTNINQELDLLFSLDLVSGGITDSRFIVIPTIGSINEDKTWSSTPDIKVSTFPTLTMGHDTGSFQADSSYEYLRIYEGLLVGDVTSSADADALLKDKKVLFDNTYQQKLTATDLLIANSTINDGDTVLLQGNDVDSWGAGTPLYETVVWSKNITKHNFTKSTYQYYRLFLNSSNVVSIGRIYLGTRYRTAGNQVMIPHDRKSASLKTISIAGQSYMDKRYQYSLVSTKWPLLTEEQNNKVLSIFESVDVGTPFFVTFDKAGSILGTLYVTIDEDGLKSTPLGNRNLYTMGMDFREEV